MQVTKMTSESINCKCTNPLLKYNLYGGEPMEISDKLAYEIYTIIQFHVIAVLLLISFTSYIYFKAKKTPLLFSYLSVVAMILLWMISKIFKTVSPTEQLRWFFIVTQYFGVQFLGFFLIVFANLYRTNKLPQPKTLILLGIPSTISFLIVLTNPYHMLFYSYYDFYKDRFGPLFLPTQGFQYLHLIIGVILLSRDFINQPSFIHKKKLGRFFSMLILLPIMINIYYLSFKFTDLKWIFPFPIFDITPISITLTLILFMIPAIKYRFLDISPVSYQHIYDNMPHGIVFINPKGHLYSYNQVFKKNFILCSTDVKLKDILNSMPYHKSDNQELFENFVMSSGFDIDSYVLKLQDNTCYRVMKKETTSKHLLLCFVDITAPILLNEQLHLKNSELAATNQKLEALASATRELAITRTKTHIAQNVHDILGHSLIVVIGTINLIIKDQDTATTMIRLEQSKELLINSLSDLKNSIRGKSFKLKETSLMKAISSLQNSNIQVDFVSHGTPYELDTRQTEAIFRLCQEAVTNSIKHGKATTIHIILRYKTDYIEVFAIDDGVGCSSIQKSYGLNGIENRILQLKGNVHIGSDGKKGFNIHVQIPKRQ
jgi:signal transduction histidine kinase